MFLPTVRQFDLLFYLQSMRMKHLEIEIHHKLKVEAHYNFRTSQIGQYICKGLVTRFNRTPEANKI
jgi:hypothetical protein